MVKRSGFRTKSLFIVILYFFISKPSFTNAGTVLPLLIKLIILIKISKSGLCSKKR